MVRRDATDVLLPLGKGSPAARCASPAGESPAPVGVGAPDSRPQVTRGDSRARAGRQRPVKRQKPRDGKQARGPQHQVKPAASTDKQSGSRAAHVTAKATPVAGAPKLAAGPGGARGAAHVQGEARNTRGPSLQPKSGQGGSYKPKAKLSTAERESEGTVVPETGAQAPGTNAVQNNAAGGKGPCGGQVDGPKGHHVLDADIRDYFGSIDHDKLLKLVARRWPSQRSMQRIRQRVKELTPRSRCHADLRDVISDLNPVLRGWGEYFRTGNASKRFNQLDTYVWRRLRKLRMQSKGRHLRPNDTKRWLGDYFHNLGLHRLRGTVRYPEQPFWKESA